MSAESAVGLLKLQEEIADLLGSGLQRYYWITAEISDINTKSSGHCYIELIDKREGDEAPSARAQAIIWSSTFRVLNPFFRSTAGAELTRGMKIMVRVQVQYSSLYGLSLIISDIDPSFTVGEYEVRRQQTIKRLGDEGMFELNNRLELAVLPSRVAIVSSESAAGYRDFFNHLHNNEYGFMFKTELFSASVQGLAAPAEIVQALDRVAARLDDFDMVVIIRGGGSVQDLACFDDYDLALNIAQFPIPVITGIGHDHDYHVADMVAFKGLKTPTAVAEFVIDIFAGEEQRFAYLIQRLNFAIKNRKGQEFAKIDKKESDLFTKARLRITSALHRLELMEQRITSANPLKILERGYALPIVKGVQLRGIDEVKVGDTLALLLNEGKLECTINDIIKNDELQRGNRESGGDN